MRGYPHALGVCVWLAYLALAPFLQKVGLFDVAPWLSRFDEVAFLAALPAAYVGAKALYATFPAIRVAAALFLAYLACGVASWFGSGISPLAAILQGLLELKLPAVLCALIGLGLARHSDRYLSRIPTVVKVLLVLSVLFILFHLVAPVTYGLIFPSTQEAGVFILPTGATLSRFSGVFGHPTELAYFCASTFGFFGLRFLLRGRRIPDLGWAILSLLLLGASFERQETVTALFLLPAIAFWAIPMRDRETRVLTGVASAGIALGALVGVVLLLRPYLAFVIARLGLASAATSSGVARVVFYTSAWKLAKAHFPLGVGLGGFGGYAAELFGSPVYHALGFSKFQWFQAGRFLTDTYWPHVLGEAGWIGLAFYVSALGVVVVLLLREIRARRRLAASCAGVAAALYGLLFLLGTSLTSAVLTTMFPLATALIWFVGLVLRLDVPERPAQNTV